jgi:hypothetical protein
VTLNAITGAVVEIHEETLPRMKRKEQAQVISKSAQTTSYLDAKNKFVADNNDSPGEVAQGTAQVFDPNPVTALGRTDLSDNSSASEFLKAYKTEDLKDITLQGGLYRLIGPKVTIVDFESPRVAPRQQLMATGFLKEKMSLSTMP